MAEANATPKQDAPKQKRGPARIEHSAAIAAYAKARNIDTTRAGKLFRARLRSNFATIAKNDPKHYGPKGTFKVNANDKRPWGSHSRATLKQLGLGK
jgi:hypothetical protein